MITLGAVASKVDWTIGQLPDRHDTFGFPGDSTTATGAQHIHDPRVICFGEQYFCFCTSPAGFTAVHRSRDLKSWHFWGPILGDTPAWLAARYSHRSIWAPDVVVLGDSLRMYYCTSNFGTNQSVIGLAECERFDPENPLDGWFDQGPVIESVKGRSFFNAIDAKVVVDSQRHWLFFGSYFAGIHLAELDSVSGRLLNSSAEPLCVAKNAEPGNPIEAASVCFKDGFFYLFVSYGLAAQGVRSTYRIVVGRSESVTGPFVDRNGKPMLEGGHEPFLKSSFPVIGPGGSDVFRDSDGRWLMSYHFYDARAHWHGDLWGMPTLQVREILWTQDGWPMPGMPVEALEQAPTSNGHQLAGKWVQQIDFGQPEEIQLVRDGSLLNGGRLGRWERAEERLTLHFDATDDSEQFTIESLQVAYDGKYLVGRTSDGRIVRALKLPAEASA